MSDGPRSQAITSALADLGFVVRQEGGRTVAESVSLEAKEAKRYLRWLDFDDREYQVFVEFVRQWGIM